MAISSAYPGTHAERRARHHGGTGMPHGRRRLSEILLSKHMLAPAQLRRAVRHAEQHSVPLADAVVSLGFVSETDSYAALAAVTGLPLVDLAELRVAESTARLLPEKLARRHTLLPIHAADGVLTYAVTRPFDDQAERDVAFASERRPRAVLASPSQLHAAMNRLYPRSAVRGIKTSRAMSRS